MKKAVQRLDLIVFLPIEDRIPVPDDEDKRLRRKVDELLIEIILEDSTGILEDVTVLEITGNIEKRIESIKACGVFNLKNN